MIADAATEIMEIVARLRPVVFPVLAGHGPAIQGGVLMDLVAMWLAGHCIVGDADATRALRADLLSNALLMLDELVAINAEAIGTPHDPVSHGSRA